MLQVAQDASHLRALPALYLRKGRLWLQLILAYAQAGEDGLFSVPAWLPWGPAKLWVLQGKYKQEVMMNRYYDNVAAEINTHRCAYACVGSCVHVYTHT